MSSKKVLVLVYSTYGHVKKIAEAEIEGLKESGVEVRYRSVTETLSAEILEKMHAPKSDLEVVTHDDLLWADGYLFGFATRYGSAPAQFKTFWDSTGQLWFQGKLKGKFCGIFQSTGGLGGGQETAALSFLPNLVHHGIIFVPLGFHPSFNKHEYRGSSYYGAGTIAGADGSKQPTATDLEIAKHQGKEFGDLLNKLK